MPRHGMACLGRQFIYSGCKIISLVSIQDPGCKLTSLFLIQDPGCKLISLFLIQAAHNQLACLLGLLGLLACLACLACLAKPLPFLRHAAQDCGTIDKSGTKPGPGKAIVFPGPEIPATIRDGLSTAAKTLAKYPAARK